MHTRGFAPGASSSGTLQEQSSSVCTNDFMGILHPREQNFHPAKYSTIFNRLNIWEQAPGANNAPSCVLTRAKSSWSMLREQNPSCVSAFSLREGNSSLGWSSLGWISGISLLLVRNERHEYSGYKAMLLTDMLIEAIKTVE